MRIEVDVGCLQQAYMLSSRWLFARHISRIARLWGWLVKQVYVYVLAGAGAWGAGAPLHAATGLRHI